MKTLLLILTFVLSSLLFGSEPTGSPTAGKLLNGYVLPESGEGYLGMYREDERYWGTIQMINMLLNAASEIEQNYPGRDRLQIEDIGQKGGGNITGHSSHRNGLDADVGYYKLDGVEHDPDLKNQMYADPMFVNGKVSSNFDHQRNWELMKALHKHGNVQKIFIDENLKKSLCTYAKKIGEYSNNLHVLRSLRHVTNHRDHLHVRLRCPKDVKRCVNLAEAPNGAGC